MKIKLEATIPTTPYGNLRPVFELEDGDDESTALAALQKLWDRFGDTPLKDKTSGGVELITFTGEKIFWNESTHTYTDTAGHVLLSGSKYADMNSPKFDLEVMLPKTAKAWEVSEEELGTLWKMNSTVSTSFGTAIHNALEIYHNHHKMGEQIKEQKELEFNYVLPKQPYLRKIVLDFVEKYGVDNVEAEALVSDTSKGMAGTIDRLEITGDMKCRVGDYKTNAEMDAKKKKKYQLQLSFYAQILKNHGWTVEGLDLFHYSDEDGWVKDELEILDVAL